jgi:hypothetical protein
MPADIAELIGERNLKAAFEERPPYQRNDYLGWIARARRARLASDARTDAR